MDMSEATNITAADTDDIVAIVWADGTYTTASGTFVGGRREAKATVAAAQALAALEA